MSDDIEPHIYRKFEVLQRLGKGAYGIVWKVVERKTKQTMALKKVFDAFHNDTDAQRTFREVMILQELDHDNMVKLFNVIKAENNKDLYLVFEYVETDLHSVIRAGILEEIHKEFIIYQMLKALLYLHTAEIIHRDLKPSNILINSACEIKIADFGLARSVLPSDDETAPIMTEYVATRWYRAPEIVLGSTHYSKAVDMWSVGCILGELITGRAIFPGKSTINQIELILDLLGKPKPDDMEDIGGATDWNIINSINSKQKYSFSTFFRGASKNAIDFLKKCLEFSPKKRISVEEALIHPFVAQFHDPTQEKRSTKIIEIPISDQKRLSIREYREALYADIIKKKKEQRRKWQLAYLNGLGIKVADEAEGSGVPMQLQPQPPNISNTLTSANIISSQTPVTNNSQYTPTQSVVSSTQSSNPKYGYVATQGQGGKVVSNGISSEKSKEPSFVPSNGVFKERVTTGTSTYTNNVPSNGVYKPSTAGQTKPKEPSKQISSPKATQPAGGAGNMQYQDYMSGLFKK